MNDDELRALIRAAIQTAPGSAPRAQCESRRRAASGRRSWRRRQISFGRYRSSGAEDDSACLIEPAVRCNHCGYCQCHGH